MDDRREARAEGGRRFQREGAIMAKDTCNKTLVPNGIVVKLLLCGKSDDDDHHCGFMKMIMMMMTTIDMMLMLMSKSELRALPS